MKKILLPLLMSAVMLLAACGSASERPREETAPSAPAAGAPGKSDGTQMEHVAEEAGTVDGERTEKAFIGQWHSVRTTSDNSAFTYLELDVTEDKYTVALSFDNGEITSYTGKYEVNDGVLSFDESFIGCKAYFFEEDFSTLVVDNGSSLVFCEHTETEEELLSGIPAKIAK